MAVSSTVMHRTTYGSKLQTYFQDFGNMNVNDWEPCVQIEGLVWEEKAKGTSSTQ